MMQFMPPMQNEDAIRADLAKIGVEAGKPFNLDSQSGSTTGCRFWSA